MSNGMEPTLPPPNGDRVTQAQLYEALYRLDLGLSDRFTTLLDTINDLRRAVDQHLLEGHPTPPPNELTNKKAAFKTALFGALAAGLAALGVLLQRYGLPPPPLP